MSAAARQRMVAVLSRYVTATTAAGLIKESVRASGIDPDRAQSEHELARFAEVLDGGVRPFLTDARLADLRAELRIAVASRATRSRSFAIQNEEDVSRARLSARQLCLEWGAASFLGQQTATCVSELARNMVQYAGGGMLELSVQDGARRAVLVRATDRGPGIPNLDEIYGGTYRSKTGQGRGINGVRRVANRFELSTGPQGTTVEFEVWL